LKVVTSAAENEWFTNVVQYPKAFIPIVWAVGVAPIISFRLGLIEFILDDTFLLPVTTSEYLSGLTKHEDIPKTITEVSSQNAGKMAAPSPQPPGMTSLPGMTFTSTERQQQQQQHWEVIDLK